MTDMMNSQMIRELIEAGLPGSEVQVFGEDGAHFEAVVIAPQFRDCALVRRHQLVYACLGDLMGQEIHALQLSRTLTPEEAHGRS